MSQILPRPGEVFEGRYRIDQQIGEGGFAAVFRATDTQTGQPVAIKILTPGDEEWMRVDKLSRRFEREARLMGELNNEHTVTLLEFSRSANNQLYLVFEYVDGTTLGELVDRFGALPPRRVVSILQQVLSALEEAHQIGVLHRDIKPDNVMVYQHMGIRDLVKLIDFGIAKPLGREEGGSYDGTKLTTAGLVLGTPRYMSPEQFTGSRLTPATDIYSLGLVAFELLVGLPAVDADSSTGIVREQLSPEPFKVPRDADVPAGLRKVVEKMTAKSRGERYAQVSEVLADLKNWEGGGFSLPFPVKLETVAAALVALVVVAGGALYVLRSEDGPETQQVDPRSVQLQPNDPGGGEPVGHAPDEPAAVEKHAPSEQTNGPASDEPTATTDDENQDGGEDKQDNGARTPTHNAPNIEDDGIEVHHVKSQAEAKSVATAAYTQANWKSVIAVCKPYAATSTFCARMTAESYKNRGDFEHACQWFEYLGETDHGLDCD